MVIVKKRNNIVVDYSDLKCLSFQRVSVEAVLVSSPRTTSFAFIALFFLSDGQKVAKNKQNEISGEKETILAKIP